MSLFAFRIAVVTFGWLVAAGTAFAQSPAGVAAPRFERVAAPASRRGAPINGLGINVHGGLGLHSSGGLVDDVCGVVDLAYGFEGFESTRCGGSGGGTPFTIGAFLSYAKPFGSTRLQFQGGYHFTSENEIRLDSDATYSDFNAEISLTGGYRFTSQAFYGGAGVELADFYIGGTVGAVRHSGEEFVSAQLRLDGVVYDQIDEDRPKSGMSPMFGVRAMYSLRPGIKAYGDFYAFGLGDYFDSFEAGAAPLPLPMPVPLDFPVRDRVLAFGIVIDVYSYFR